MKDFSLKTYKKILASIVKLDLGYKFQTFEQFIENPEKKVIIIRHDIDRTPKNALKSAIIETDLGINASYYFRVVQDIFNPEIVREIVKLGHEVSYHYEDLTIFSGDKEKAIEHFKEKLNLIRDYYPAKTICMHGSPMSKWDNRQIWESYNYKDYGIIAEPYFEIDFNEVYYLTDAGRAWNSKTVNRRDRVSTKYNYDINSLEDFVDLIQSKDAPNKIMFNIHPHNWADSTVEWFKIWAWQSMKNLVKRILILRTK